MYIVYYVSCVNHALQMHGTAVDRIIIHARGKVMGRYSAVIGRANYTFFLTNIS